MKKYVRIAQYSLIVCHYLNYTLVSLFVKDDTMIQVFTLVKAPIMCFLMVMFTKRPNLFSKSSIPVLNGFAIVSTIFIIVWIFNLELKYLSYQVFYFASVTLEFLFGYFAVKHQPEDSS